MPDYTIKFVPVCQMKLSSPFENAFIAYVSCYSLVINQV